MLQLTPTDITLVGSVDNVPILVTQQSCSKEQELESDAIAVISQVKKVRNYEKFYSQSKYFIITVFL